MASNSTASTGLGATDWAGMGMQVGGALLSDSQEKKKRKEDLERENRLLRQKRQQDLQDMGRARMDQQRQLFEANQSRKRGQNMQGLDFLNSQVADAQKLGRQMSFRDALMSTGGR